MTEAEWLASANPTPMLRALSGVACSRKWRLFAIESFRHLPHDFNFPLLAEAVALAVAEVDEIAHPPSNVREEMRFESWRSSYDEEDPAQDDDPRMDLARAAQVMLSQHVQHTGAGRSVIHHLHVAICNAGHGALVAGFWTAQAALLRDIFGNPFAPNWFRPAWRTDTAVAIARQMYESREFSAMPILADAVQDAGCEDEQVLMHCRGATAAHVRGCWVCDLVLGKA